MAAVIFVHGYPSGDPDPSPDGIEIIGRLKEVSEIMGVGILGHVIVGGWKGLSTQGGS